MNKYQKRVMKLEYKPNCYVLVSGPKRDMRETHGEVLIEANVSLFYDGGSSGAEWEIEYGPIQTFVKCDADHPNAKEHYFYDYVIHNPLSWSQLAVSQYELPKAFNEGDFDYIFGVLECWVRK